MTRECPLKEVAAYKAVRALNHCNMPQDAKAELHNEFKFTFALTSDDQHEVEHPLGHEASKASSLT